MTAARAASYAAARQRLEGRTRVKAGGPAWELGPRKRCNEAGARVYSSVYLFELQLLADGGCAQARVGNDTGRSLKRSHTQQHKRTFERFELVAQLPRLVTRITQLILRGAAQDIASAPCVRLRSCRAAA